MSYQLPQQRCVRGSYFHPPHRRRHFTSAKSTFIRIATSANYSQSSQVCKLYYYLTQQPIIWKRFLHRLKIPIPPLPPTARYTLGKLARQVEELVIRAISLDDNWRSLTPKTYRIHELKAYHEVLEMTVLPGGKYLVASVDQGFRRYAIIIFALDHTGGESVALARTTTDTKAYSLQAKFMTHHDIQGIVISYLTRKFKGRELERAGFVACCLLFICLPYQTTVVLIRRITAPRQGSTRRFHSNMSASVFMCPLVLSKALAIPR
jgi:hypothetical protein